ncbi:hypothetical protein Rsub_07455 [Raphidocelis subcapitata]|uniref:Rieske domain-containing protein n=1 Tax=Raphidocelis subcapitata TaxID=307507 RepID=A0A2V0P506_9CHLO|nr:hypothetical protein Rsub_07455 [Raphidocelis subcapitata]|eukprot:GBF94954.1 hypothetical protein Rsub_07455 [Raphidocelis subcapitata]
MAPCSAHSAQFRAPRAPVSIARPALGRAAVHRAAGVARRPLTTRPRGPVERGQPSSTAATAPAQTALDTPAAQAADAPFSYERTWWAVHDLASIDPDRPNALELLGKKLVLWRDGEGKWRCNEDMCPHRLAPLSEGRTVDGQLECSYHGWRFNSGGRCVRIPQSVDAKAEATACASSRSCVRSYPVREQSGIIWVWAHPGSPDEAESSPLPIPLGLQQLVASGKRIRWFRRVLPYSWDVLLENVVDPAHLPHSHHKLTPMLTRDKSGPMPFASVQQQRQHASNGADHSAASGSSSGSSSSSSSGSSSGSGADGGGAEAPDYAPPGMPPVGAFAFPSALSASGVVAFTPPALVAYEYALPGSAKLWTWIYAAPAGPGRSIVLTTTGNTRPSVTPGMLAKALLTAPKTLPPLLMNYYIQNIPMWRSHLLSNKLFDQDSVFLAQQDALLQRKGRQSWTSDYYLPIQSDLLVTATRRWIDSKAGGGPAYAEGAEPMGPTPSTEQIQDRWSQHTRHCKACRDAMAAMAVKAARARGAAAALFAALCALLGTYGAPGLLAGGAPALLAAAAAAGAAVALAVARRAAATVQAFKHVPFSHADNE